MTSEDRILMLERALANYVAKYGFSDDARAYFMRDFRLDPNDWPTPKAKPSRPH